MVGVESTQKMGTEELAKQEIQSKQARSDYHSIADRNVASGPSGQHAPCSCKSAARI
jgi:hypothetical protein